MDAPDYETGSPSRRLYEGVGSVKKLRSSELRGKRIISGLFGDTNMLLTTGNISETKHTAKAGGLAKMT